MDELGRLLYVATITIADDEGRFEADPALLHGQLCVGLRYSAEDVSAALLALDRIDLVRVYRVGEDWIGDHPKWSKYQKPKYKKDSKLQGFRADCPRFRDRAGPNPADVGHGVGVGVGVVEVVGVGVGVVDTDNQSKDSVRTKRERVPTEHGRLLNEQCNALIAMHSAWFQKVYGIAHATVGRPHFMALRSKVASMVKDMEQTPWAADDLLDAWALVVETANSALPRPWFMKGGQHIDLMMVVTHWSWLWMHANKTAREDGRWESAKKKWLARQSEVSVS